MEERVTQFFLSSLCLFVQTGGSFLRDLLEWRLFFVFSRTRGKFASDGEVEDLIYECQNARFMRFYVS